MRTCALSTLDHYHQRKGGVHVQRLKHKPNMQKYCIPAPSRFLASTIIPKEGCPSALDHYHQRKGGVHAWSHK